VRLVQAFGLLLEILETGTGG